MQMFNTLTDAGAGCERAQSRNPLVASRKVNAAATSTPISLGQSQAAVDKVPFFQVYLFCCAIANFETHQKERS